MSSKISSLIICAFLLLTVFHFFPTCLSARNLAESPQINGSDIADHEDDDQSKSNVHGSSAGHAGSATNDNVPADGAVNVPPPTPITRVVNRGNGGVQWVQSNGNGNGVVASSNNHNGDQTVVNKNNGYEGVGTRDGNGGQTVVTKSNGTETVAIRNENGNTIVVTRDKNGAESITMNNNQTISANAMSPPMSP